ncbi:MAG: methionine/alanine import family NSS transporter small subunit [Acinetobacter sp.]|nr:methionine/alanine import family NSS transporter small subunit [Acinetobacter sp.]
MNTSAIIMMMISIILLWGGLVLSILHLMKHPDTSNDD